MYLFGIENIADIFEKVGLAKIVREKGSDELTNAVQDAMIELSKSIPQPKQQWSEEDEEMFDAIIADIQFTQKAHIHDDNKVVYEREISWLESLKERRKSVI